MITTKPLFFILIVIGIVIPVFLIADHIVNYETWGNNDEYFDKSFDGYEITCDVNYFADPSNCMIIDDDGKQVPNEIILNSTQFNGCYFFENDHIVPCRMD